MVRTLGNLNPWATGSLFQRPDNSPSGGLQEWCRNIRDAIYIRLLHDHANSEKITRPHRSVGHDLDWKLLARMPRVNSGRSDGRAGGFAPRSRRRRRRGGGGGFGASGLDSGSDTCSARPSQHTHSHHLHPLIVSTCVPELDGGLHGGLLIADECMTRFPGGRQHTAPAFARVASETRLVSACSTRRGVTQGGHPLSIQVRRGHPENERLYQCRFFPSTTLFREAVARSSLVPPGHLPHLFSVFTAHRHHSTHGGSGGLGVHAEEAWWWRTGSSPFREVLGEF